MERIIYRNLIMLFFLLSFVVLTGCVGKYYSANPTGNYLFYPAELPAADNAVEEARMAGKHAQCPKAFNKAESLKDEAFKVYNQCDTEKAIALANEAKALADSLCPSISAPVPEPAPVIEKMKVHVYFDLDKSVIKEEYYPKLNKAISFAKKYSDAEILIEGHTDSRASDEYNQALSNRRTDAVKNYFVSNGINKDRIRTLGYGESRPSSSNDTEYGTAQNRRVDVFIMN